jgi:hypothetical protein
MKNLALAVFQKRNFKTNSRTKNDKRFRSKTSRCRTRTKYIKKSNRHFSQERSMRYDFIKNNQKIFPIEKMCQVLRVSSSEYYR